MPAMSDAAPDAPSGPAKIFGIGLSKTGTTSLYAALHELGYAAATFRHMKRLGMESWFEGDFSPDYLAEYEAITDLPLGSFYPALDKRYPGSKFILTLRDVDKWLRSVEKQFTRRANPKPGFVRDVRVGAYGLATFNEDVFRHVYHSHVENVRRYFADRPDDLLVIDVTAGDGWPELCGFLGRDRPDTPFPNVKPGWRPEGELQPAETTLVPRRERAPRRAGDAPEPFVVVIPVRNPKDDKVNDYAVIESLLERTVTSVLRQTHPATSVVVVCHGAPAWAKGYAGDVHFLDVSDDPVFPPNTHDVKVDKGLKYTLGAAYARAHLSPELILLMDADDYANVRLAETVLAERADHGELDAYLVEKGVHVVVRVEDDRTIAFDEAYAVDRFPGSCGSCRVFEAESLLARIDAIAPGLRDALAEWPARGDDLTVRVPREHSQRLWDATEGTREDEPSIIQILGRHTHQHEYLVLRAVPLLGAAKGCGHGNHDGPMGGGVHQHRVAGEIDIDDFLDAFGLREGPPPTLRRLQRAAFSMSRRLRGRDRKHNGLQL
jgi:hypothetical protein